MKRNIEDIRTKRLKIISPWAVKLANMRKKRKDFCEDCGIHYQQFSRYMQLRTTPSETTINKINNKLKELENERPTKLIPQPRKSKERC